jgi:high-affinity nickel-transport protein
MQNADINTLGFFIVGLFIATWVAALLIWRYGNIEQKWSEGMRQHEAVPDSLD